MAGRSFNVADLDFDAITDEIGKLVAPRVSLEEVLAKVRDQMVAQKKKGVSVAQMKEVFNRRGIEVSERALRAYIEKGELPVHKRQGPRSREVDGGGVDRGTVPGGGPAEGR